MTYIYHILSYKDHKILQGNNVNKNEACIHNIGGTTLHTLHTNMYNFDTNGPLQSLW